MAIRGPVFAGHSAKLRSKSQIGYKIPRSASESGPTSVNRASVRLANRSQTHADATLPRVFGETATTKGSGDCNKWFEEALIRLPQRDRKNLERVAHQKSRSILRCLSYPGLPSNPDGEQRSSAVASKPEPDRGTKVPLEIALSNATDAKTIQDWIHETRIPLAQDLSAQVCPRDGSLAWLDTHGLVEELDQNIGAGSEHQVRYIGGVDAYSSSVLVPCNVMDVASDLPARASQGGSDSPSIPGSPSSRTKPVSSTWKLARPHPALDGRRWPTIAQFMDFHHTPEDALPPPPPVAEPERDPLPEGRPTISRLDEAVGRGPLPQRMINALANITQREQACAQQRPLSGKPAGFFEVAAVYRNACEQMGIKPLRPAPFFGERVEICQEFTHTTQQCYAVAEGLSACLPRELVISNALLTDRGTARIITSAMMGGRLKTLFLSGSPLSYRTSVAFYNCLQTKKGQSLTALTLTRCGLGGNLDINPAELPQAASAAYAKSRVEFEETDHNPSDGIRDESVCSEHNEDEPKDFTDHDTASVIGPQKALTEKNDRCPTGESEHENDDMDGDVEEDVPVVTPMPVLLPLLAQLARLDCRVRKLDLSRSALSYMTVSYLASALAKGSIETLALNQCSIEADSLQLLVQGIAENRHLIELQLRHNNFGKSPVTIGQLLQTAGRHVRLAHFDLTDNELPAACIADLCSMLRWTCSLVAVHILGDCTDGPESLEVAASCRRWVAEQSEGTKIEELQSTPLAISGSSLKRETEHETTGEVVLCRALHVDGLLNWRIHEVSRRQLSPSNAASLQAELASAPHSWMPSSCWICTQCKDMMFRWEVPDRGAGDESGVAGARMFVRPSFADFSPVELLRQRVAGVKRVVFSSRLLVPPGTHYYLFESIVGKEKLLLCAQDQTSVDVAEAALTKSQLQILKDLCKERYTGHLNQLQQVPCKDFSIPEDFGLETEGEPVIDAWAQDPKRVKDLRSCYETDLAQFHLVDLCHADEEAEVIETIWELYGRLYDTYAIFAGRSQWPLVRQVDVYGFFEEAQLLHRGPFVKSSVDELRTESTQTDVANLPQGATCPKLRCFKVEEVQQIVVQTIAHREEKRTGNCRNDTLASRAAAVVQRTREGGPITRPQFIEVLLRTAILLQGRERSTSLSFKMFVDGVLSNRILKVPLSPFPTGLRLRTGPVCDCLLAWRKILRLAWERFGGNENAFQRLANHLKLCDRSFTAKHVSSIYALLRTPFADFKIAKSPASLTYDQFCEGLARLSLIWQRTARYGSTTQSSTPSWPEQPQVGGPVKDRAIAARLDAFLRKMAERMKPVVPVSTGT